MPELPEVETIKNELAPHITGRQITDVTLLWERIVRQPSPEDFRRRLIGRRVTGLSRRGKYLIFSLDSGETLIVHLKMSGSLLLNAPSDKFVRAIIQFNGEKIYFRDPRKFGVMWLVGDKNEIVGKLGPEPFEPDFTTEVLAERLRNRAAPIKALLNDQEFIAGIGNMYADEVLFASRIHPLRSGGSLTGEEVSRLYTAIRVVLTAAIGRKGASVREYFRPGGELGTAHFEFKVAHRGGETCQCGSKVERITVRNRGTYFCPRCQPDPARDSGKAAGVAQQAKQRRNKR